MSSARRSGSAGLRTWAPTTPPRLQGGLEHAGLTATRARAFAPTAPTHFRFLECKRKKEKRLGRVFDLSKYFLLVEDFHRWGVERLEQPSIAIKKQPLPCSNPLVAACAPAGGGGAIRDPGPRLARGPPEPASAARCAKHFARRATDRVLRAPGAACALPGKMQAPERAHYAGTIRPPLPVDAGFRHAPTALGSVFVRVP